jgi:hypothetical protein
MENTFNPLRPTTFASHVAKLKETIKVAVYRTADKERLYLAEEGNPQVVLAMFSKNIQSQADLKPDTMIAYFLNTQGEEVPVVYNTGKEVAFTL